MNLELAQRMASMSPFQVMAIRDRAAALERQGVQVVHMEVGEPDFASAAPVCEAACDAIRAGHTGYTSALGLPELREAIAAYYARWHGVELDPSRVVVTAGATAGLVMLNALLLEQGDAILMADPCYPCNRQMPQLVGARADLVATGAARAHQLDAQSAAAAWTDRTRGVLLASPANPTGAMVRSDVLAELIEANLARGAFTIVDEIYQGLSYPAALDPLAADSRHGQVAEGYASTVLQQFPQDDLPLFVVNSFSKYFGMTGWRVGWLVAPTAAVPELEKLAQNFWIAPSTPGQFAALAALSDAAMDIHETRRREFCARRNLLVDGLRRLGFDVPFVPQGAFYVHAGLGALPLDAAEFCMRLLEEQGVAVTPGSDFGDAQAARRVRFAYAIGLDGIETALARIEAFIRSL